MGDWSDYESGPFCSHWSDAFDCDEPCLGCGHECREHVSGICVPYVKDADCLCKRFLKPEDIARAR